NRRHSHMRFFAATIRFRARMTTTRANSAVAERIEPGEELSAGAPSPGQFASESPSRPLSWDVVSYLRGQFTASQLAIACVFATLIFMITGRVLQGAELTAWSWAAYTAAYIAGGWFAVRAAWESLRELHIDVDLLM